MILIADSSALITLSIADGLHLLDTMMRPPLYMGQALYQQALTLAGE